MHYLLTCSTGIPAIIELGSSSADELTVSFAPTTRVRSVSGKSELIKTLMMEIHCWDCWLEL